GGVRLMDWARILAFVTGMVDQELLARIEYLAAENRILKAQLKGRLKLSDAERATLAEIGHRLGRKVLGEVANVARPDRGSRRAHHRARGQVDGRASPAGHESSNEGRRLDRHARGHHRATAGGSAAYCHATAGGAPRHNRKRDLDVPQARRKSSANRGRQS